MFDSRVSGFEAKAEIETRLMYRGQKNESLQCNATRCAETEEPAK
jgi:hypothetical protein